MSRYYIKEHAGYPINVASSSPGGGKRNGSIEVLVFDHAYCHRVVWSSWWKSGPQGCNHPLRLAKARRESAALCAEWNAEDRRESRAVKRKEA